MALTLKDCEQSNIKLIRGDLGNFDHGYEFWCNDENYMQLMIDWMVQNCSKNFIITRQMTHIVAGGFTDNDGAWKKNKFNLNKMRFKRRGNQPRAIGPLWRVKMYNDDHVAFSMRWLDS